MCLLVPCSISMLCIFVLSLGLSVPPCYLCMSLMVCYGVYVYMLTLCMSVCLSLYHLCVSMLSLCSLHVFVCVSVSSVCMSICTSVLSYLCAVSLLFSVSRCELMLPWYACLHVTCVFLCLCVHHTRLCGLSSAVCCLAYFLWPLRQFL